MILQTSKNKTIHYKYQYYHLEMRNQKQNRSKLGYLGSLSTLLKHMLLRNKELHLISFIIWKWGRIMQRGNSSIKG